MFHWFRLLALSLACALLASPAYPAPFSVSVSGLGTASGPGPQSLLNGAFTGSLGTNGVASATANRGILKAKSFCQNPVSCLCTPQTDRTEGGTADLNATDLLITGPPEVTQLATTLHLALDGVLTVGGQFPWGSTVQVLIICGTGGGSGYINLSGPNDGGLRSGGILAGQISPIVSRSIDIPTVVPVNTPFNLSMSLIAGTGGTSLGVSANSASSDFFAGGGLHFPTAGAFKAGSSRNDLGAASGPVFTLPAGYSANIPSLNVVNNSWLNNDPTPVASTSWGHLRSRYR